MWRALAATVVPFEKWTPLEVSVGTSASLPLPTMLEKLRDEDVEHAYKRARSVRDHRLALDCLFTRDARAKCLGVEVATTKRVLPCTILMMLTGLLLVQ
jgi:hypothetical protein